MTYDTNEPGAAEQAPECPKHPGSRMVYASGTEDCHDLAAPHWRCELWVGGGVCGQTLPIEELPPRENLGNVRREDVFARGLRIRERAGPGREFEVLACANDATRTDLNPLPRVMILRDLNLPPDLGIYAVPLVRVLEPGRFYVIERPAEIEPVVPYTRREDAHGSHGAGSIEVDTREDGTVYLLADQGDGENAGLVAFTLGGKSPRVRAALLDLARAIAAENATDPSRDGGEG